MFKIKKNVFSTLGLLALVGVSVQAGPPRFLGEVYNEKNVVGFEWDFRELGPQEKAVIRDLSGHLQITMYDIDKSGNVIHQAVFREGTVTRGRTPGTLQVSFEGKPGRRPQFQRPGTVSINLNDTHVVIGVKDIEDRNRPLCAGEHDLLDDVTVQYFRTVRDQDPTAEWGIRGRD